LFMSTTSNLKNPLVIRQGNTIGWNNDLWPTIDNSIVNSKNRLGKELLKLKIFPLRIRTVDAKMTVIYYKWYQRVFKSRVHLQHHRYLKKHLIAYVQKKGKIKQGIRRKSKGKKRYAKKYFYNRFKISKYKFSPSKQVRRLRRWHKKGAKRSGKALIRVRFIGRQKLREKRKKLKNWFKHRNRYAQKIYYRLVNRQRKVGVNKQVIDADYKVTKVVPLQKKVRNNETAKTYSSF